MSWVAAGVGVVGTVASSLLGSSSADKAKRAARRQEQMSISRANAAAAQERAMYEQTRRDYEPWRLAGEGAVNELARMIDAGPGDYTRSPGYAYRLKEGEDAIQRSAAARGRALDPSTMEALQRHGQDYATQDYDNFLNRYYQSLTPYQSLAGMGQTATSSIANLGAGSAARQGSYAMQPVQYYGQAGMADAQGTANQANLLSNFANQMSTLAGSGAFNRGKF